MFTENKSDNDSAQTVAFETIPVKVVYLPKACCETIDHSVLDKITQAEQPPMALAWLAWCQNWSLKTFKEISTILDQGLFCVINNNTHIGIKVIKDTIQKCNHVLAQQTQEEEKASLKQLEHSAKKQCIKLDVENKKMYSIAHEFQQTGVDFCAWHWRLGKSQQSQNDIAELLHFTEMHLRALTGWKSNVLGLNGFCGIQLGEGGVVDGGGLCTWDQYNFGSSQHTTCLIDYLLIEEGKIRVPSLMHEWAHALDRMLGSLKDLQPTNKVKGFNWSIISNGFCKPWRWNENAFNSELCFRPNLSYPYSPVNKLSHPAMNKSVEVFDRLFKAQAWSNLNEFERAEKSKQWVSSISNRVQPKKHLGFLGEMWNICLKKPGDLDLLPICTSHIFAGWPGDYDREYACMIASCAEAWVKTAWLVCKLEKRKKILRFHPLDITNRLTKNMKYSPQDEKKWRTTTLMERFAQSFEDYAHPTPLVLWNAEVEGKVLPCDKPKHKKSWGDFFDAVRPILNPYFKEE